MKDRLLILAPRGRDAEVAASLFSRNGIDALVCRDVADLLDAVEAGAGSVIITEEALSQADAGGLVDWIAAQPEWSDLPFVVLANGDRAPRSERALQRLRSLGNLVLLERPLHAEAMLGAVRSALAARARQYQVRDVVAELREGERHLRESERELRFTLNAGRLGAWTLDLTNDELTTSETCRANFGRVTDQPFSYDELRDAVHPDDRARMAAAVDLSVSTGADYDIEYRVVTPASELRWVLIRARPVFGNDGVPLRMTGVSIDVTDRKREEISKACLAELADAIRDFNDPDDLAFAAAAIVGRALGVSRVGYATVDPDAETLHVKRDWTSPGIGSLAGVTRLRDYGSFIDSLKRGEFIAISDVRADELTAAAAMVLERESARSFVNAPVIEQGRLAAVLFVNHAVARRWTPEELALVREIAERTRTAVERSRVDAALRDSETRYRTLFESVEQGFCVFDMVFDAAGRPIDYVFTEVNPAFEAQTGLTDAVGKRISELAPGHEQRWYDLYGGVAMTGVPVRGEDYAQALGRWFELYAYRVDAPEKRRVAALFADVTARKAAEARVRELNETLEQRVAERTAERNRVWEGSRDILVTADLDGVFRDVNPAWTRILGNTHDEVVGHSFSDFVWPDDLADTADAVAAAGTGLDVDGFENRYRALDGTPRWISWRTAAEGDLIYGYGRDVTAEKQRAAELAQAQAALRQSQKMEAVGQLTGGIAHDFNNMLTGVIGAMDIMKRRLAAGRTDDLERFMDAAATSAQRAAALTARLLAFSRRQSLDAKPTDIDTLAEGLRDLLQRTIHENISLSIVPTAGLPLAMTDANQLENAILNLVINARDAMPDGGQLTVETAAVELDAAYAAARPDVVAGRYVVVAVSDTGVGIAPEVLEKVFDPFFSTKPTGQGTGLGLSMVYGFARQSGGQVRVHSEVGVGTSVKLYLPVADAAPEHDDDDNGGKVAEGRGEIVLLVEDDSSVRLLVREVLEELGYRTLEAADADAALPIIRSDQRIDLMVSDVGLPGMNGRQLAELAREHRADLPVLFVTGYAENAAIRAGFLGTRMGMITKPFAIDALSAKIAEMMAS